MSVTSGFFNSLNHDRRYNAQQMSAIFDGIINDGVFANIGVAFAINADTGVTITIGKGKAWFNSAWVYNDALLPKTLEGSEVVLDRIDAVVVEVDHSESVRMGDIKIVKGTPSSSPKRPTMVATDKKSQHPLAYIYRKAGSTEITQADITNMVGTSECPYITGILQVQNIDNIVAQWNAQWNQWYAEKIAETDSDASELLADMKSEFDIWFADVQALLDDDVATALAAQVAALQGQFDDLARDGAVYDTIEDSDLDVILGSDGTPIQGKTVFGAGGSDVDLSGYAKREDLEKVEENLKMVSASKLDRTEKFVRNLLDNSDFRNPVNQRGKTTLTGAIWTHIVDRWYINLQAGITATLTESGLSVSGDCFIQQRFVKGYLRADAVYTCAAYYSDGSVELSSKPGFDNSGFDTITIYIEANKTVTCIALYEGEYTAETLPEYQPKGYGAELLECRRYYQELDYNALGNGYTGGSGGSAVLIVNTGVQMRITPSIVGTTSITVRANGVDYSAAAGAISMYQFGNASICEIVCSAANIPGKHSAAFYATSKFALSADL